MKTYRLYLTDEDKQNRVTINPPKKATRYKVCLPKETQQDRELIDHYKNRGTFEQFWAKYYEEWKKRLEDRTPKK